MNRELTKINLDNILPSKRSRVMSIEGVLSVIGCDQQPIFPRRRRRQITKLQQGQYIFNDFLHDRQTKPMRSIGNLKERYRQVQLKSNQIQKQGKKLKSSKHQVLNSKFQNENQLAQMESQKIKKCKPLRPPRPARALNPLNAFQPRRRKVRRQQMNQKKSNEPQSSNTKTQMEKIMKTEEEPKLQQSLQPQEPQAERPLIQIKIEDE